MTFKLVILSTLLVVTNAGVPAISGPPISTFAAPAIAQAIVAESDAPPHYDFAYGVNDPHTGDIKNQQESRRGDVVRGSYSLVEPDGTRRIVQYSSDPHNGFNAVVHREALAVKAVVPAVAPAAYSGVGYGGLGYTSGLGYSRAFL